MRSELISQEKNIVTIKAEFEVKEFAKNVQKAVSELSSKVSVPGFRKGHTPRKILEMRFGKQALYAEALEAMLPEAIDSIVKDYEMDLIDEPDVKIEKMEEGSPVEITLTFETTPEVVLPELSEITVDRTIARVDEKTLEGTIEEIRTRNATLTSVTDRPIEANDVVDIEYYTVVPATAETEEERHGPDTAPLDLVDGNIRREILDSLLGKNIGETVSVDVEIQEDYPEQHLAGKSISYEMTVKDVKEKIPPEMNSEFFKKILQQECETYEVFLEEVGKRILEGKTAECQSEAEYNAVEKITELAQLDLPETLIARQGEAMKKEDAEKIEKSKNMTLDKFLEESSTTAEEYEENIRKQAEAIVRRSLILDKIAENLGITVEREDFTAEMSKLAATYQIDADRLVNSLFKDEKSLIEMANKIKYRKTVKAIMDSVQINDTEEQQSDPAPAAE
ncbi:MAG: trigger factor [Synergistaceae bacterium]|nr:trigger factor [Synergistaceae bacterium]